MKTEESGATINEPVMRKLLAQALGAKEGGRHAPLREWIDELQRARLCSISLNRLRFVPERLAVLSCVFQGNLKSRLGRVMEDSQDMTVLVSDAMLPGAGGLFFVRVMDSLGEVEEWIRAQSRGCLAMSQVAEKQWLAAAPVASFQRNG